MARGKLIDGMTTIEFIKRNAGRMSPGEIARRVGTSTNCVTGMASKRGISLRMPNQKRGRKSASLVRPMLQLAPAPTEIALDRPSFNTVDDLEEASRLLRSHGWTVIRPDPFKLAKLMAESNQ